MEESNKSAVQFDNESQDISKFTESYASFNRIINSLQRKYLELKEDFTVQNSELAQANQKLVELTERNLAASEFLNNILESVSVGVIAVDQSGQITHFNPAASIILGIPANDPPGKLYREVIPVGDPVNANALRAAETGCGLESVEKKIELADGTLLQLSVSTSTLKDQMGRTCGAVEVFQDLTKIKKMEQELSRLNTLATLGEMASTIAHEVRNPLSGIAGFAGLLERDMERDNPHRKLVKKITRGVNSLNDTITALLNYTRLEQMNKVPTACNEFLTQVVEQFGLQNSEKLKDIKIIVHKPKIPSRSDVKLLLDPMLFRQVFFNIFANACEVCDGAGRIDVHYSLLARQTATSNYSKRVLFGVDETLVEFIISDNGPGIQMENLDHIFAPFFTTKQGGNGLGLAISSKIVKAHGGEIFAESSSRKGTSFKILIPTRIRAENMEQLA